jgi:hypothetical protein
VHKINKQVVVRIINPIVNSQQMPLLGILFLMRNINGIWITNCVTNMVSLNIWQRIALISRIQNHNLILQKVNLLLTSQLDREMGRRRLIFSLPLFRIVNLSLDQKKSIPTRMKHQKTSKESSDPTPSGLSN